MFSPIRKIIQYFRTVPSGLQFLWWIWLILMVVLLFLAIRPFGQVTYSLSHRPGNYFIHKLMPPERWSTSSKELVLTGQPAYFFLRPSRLFREAEIKITWQQRQTPVYLEAGVLMDKANWQYQMAPLSNAALDQLVWPTVKSGDYQLWQRRDKYNSWAHFLSDQPDYKKLAVYHWSPTTTTVNLNDYNALDEWQELPGHWRGPQQLALYLGQKEKLAWRLNISSDSWKQLSANEKTIEINVWDYQGQRRWTNKRQLSEQQVAYDILVGPWEAGAYRLEIKASPRILFKLATKQTIFAWQGQIWPVGQLESDWQIWTDAPEVVAQTIQPASRQTITIGQKAVKIEQTYQQFTARTTGANNLLQFKTGDIQLSGNGYFSLKPTIFRTQPFKVDKFLAERLDQVDFVVAKYQSPECLAGQCRATAKLSLIGADWQRGDGYKVMLAAADSQLSNDNPLVIEQIEVKLTGSTWWQFILNCWRHLVDWLKQ